jgi:hypothetical protein
MRYFYLFTPHSSSESTRNRQTLKFLNGKQTKLVFNYLNYDLVKVLELVVHPLHVESVWRDHVRPNIAEHTQLMAKMFKQPGARE